MRAVRHRVDALVASRLMQASAGQGYIRLDWQFVRGSAMLSAGMLGARLLGLAFSLILARTFNPSDFGTVQYVIALANLMTIVVQPFGQHVIARLVSHNLGKSPEMEQELTHAWVLLLTLLVVTLIVASLFIWLSDSVSYALLLVIVGIACFYGYWGLSRGYMASGRLVAAHLGSNTLQLLAVLGVVTYLGIESPDIILGIYGLSYLPVIAWLQFSSPLKAHSSIRLRSISRRTISRMLEFATPIIASHMAFMVFTTADVLMLKHLASTHVVGQYALAKTLAVVYLFTPMGISTLLMPKLASNENLSFRSLLFVLLLSVGVINGLIFIGYWSIVEWFTRSFFGDEYVVSGAISIMLALSAMLLGMQSILAAACVGRGRPGIETRGRIVAACVSVCGCWLLIPTTGSVGASISTLGGAAAALLIYGVWNISFFTTANESSSP